MAGEAEAMSEPLDLKDIRDSVRRALSGESRPTIHASGEFLAAMLDEIDHLRAELDAELEGHDQHDREQRAATLREAADELRTKRDDRGDGCFPRAAIGARRWAQWLNDRADRIEQP